MPDKSPVAKLESLDEQGRGLRVEFHQLADRYTHQILLVDPEAGACSLLVSAEHLQEPDPRSHSAAVFQALNLQALRDDPTSAATMIGMAGANHWSLAIEPSRPPAVPRLVFDVACRTKKSTVELAINYQFADGAWLAATNPAQIIACQRSAVAGGLANILLTPLTTNSETSLVEARTEGGELTLTYRPPHNHPLPTTHRWRYAIELI